jgi:hypothetical protein
VRKLETLGGLLLRLTSTRVESADGSDCADPLDCVSSANCTGVEWGWQTVRLSSKIVRRRPSRVRKE